MDSGTAVASSDLRDSAHNFVARCLERLRKAPFSEIACWPEWPLIAPLPLKVPDELSRFVFTLMKDTLPSGDIRIAIQLARPRFMGIYSEMLAEGFVIGPDGRTRSLTQQDLWDLT